MTNNNTLRINESTRTEVDSTGGLPGQHSALDKGKGISNSDGPATTNLDSPITPIASQPHIDIADLLQTLVNKVDERVRCSSVLLCSFPLLFHYSAAHITMGTGLIISPQRYHAYFMEDLKSWMVILADWISILACSLLILGLVDKKSNHKRWFWYSSIVGLPQFPWEAIWLPLGPLCGAGICLYVNHLLEESSKDVEKLRNYMYQYKARLPKFRWEAIWLPLGPLCGAGNCLYVNHLLEESSKDVETISSSLGCCLARVVISSSLTFPFPLSPFPNFPFRSSLSNDLFRLRRTMSSNYFDSMSQLTSGAGKISPVNAVVLGESLASDENDLIFPTEDFSRQALVSSPHQYMEMYKRSIDDPAGFWSDIASKFYWKKKWSDERVFSENLDVRKGPIYIEYNASA